MTVTRTLFFVTISNAPLCCLTTKQEYFDLQNDIKIVRTLKLFVYKKLENLIINCNKILVQNQLTINLVNMIFSSTQQISSSFNQLSAVRFFSSQQEIGLLQYAFVLPA